VARTTPAEYRATGDAILERMGNQKVPAAVKARLAAFKAQHARYVAACAKKATTVLVKLTAVVKPQAAYTKALAARDALLPTWSKAYAKLEKVATAPWVDEPETVASVFAAPESIQAPKARRARRRAKPAPSAPPAPPAPPG
jgi:hypothetical protein